MQRRWKATLAVTVAAVSLLGLAACGSSGSDASTGDTGGGASSDETIHIVGFAVPEAANKAIAAEWKKTPEGKGVSFETSYGASGDQSRAVESGLEADYVHFSVASDVTRLVKAGLVAEDWDKGPTNGIVSDSIVVFAVREGNPKNIQTWDDLIKPGVEIVTPEPRLVRCGPLERAGRLRPGDRRRWHRGRGRRLPRQLLRQRRRPPRQRP